MLANRCLLHNQQVYKIFATFNSMVTAQAMKAGLYILSAAQTNEVFLFVKQNFCKIQDFVIGRAQIPSLSS